MQHNQRPTLAHPMPAQQLQHQQQHIQQQQQSQPPTPQQQTNQQPPQATPAQQGYLIQYNNFTNVPPHGPQRFSNHATYQHSYPYIPAYQHAYPPNYGPQAWPNPTANYQQTLTSPQQWAPNIPVASQPLKPREKKLIRITDPKTKDEVVLERKQKTATNDTSPVNAATGQQNFKDTTPKTISIKPPPQPTSAGLTTATTTSNQLTSSTAKSTPVAQTASLQAKPITTKVEDKSNASSPLKDKTDTNAKAIITSALKVTSVESESTKAASALAVQNEFACKVSERQAGLGNVENKPKKEGTNTTVVSSSTVDKLGNSEISDKKEQLVEAATKVDAEVTKNKENVGNDEITKEKGVSKDTTEKKAVDDKEVAADIDSASAKPSAGTITSSTTTDTTTTTATTSDDSNKENDKGSDKKDEWASLHYEPGQYNPKTKSGKRKYNKDFLLAIDEIIAKEVNSSIDPLNCPVGLVDFSPPWQKNPNHGNDPLKRQNIAYYGGRSSDRQDRPKKIISTTSLGQDCELKTSSNAWKPPSVLKDEVASVNPAEAETENLKKQFRSILNKLTPNNFDNLALKVTQLQINSEAKLSDVIDIVFAKALSEPGYSVLYGRMCSHLREISAGKAAFGPTLLRRCQVQFQTDIYSGIDLNERRGKIDEEEDADKKKRMNEELYEDMYRCRMRGLGLIKFIGELYKLGMLINLIMFECIERLVSDVNDESLECLCDLLATIGEKLDTSSNQSEKVVKNKSKSQGASKAGAYQGGQKSVAAIVAQGPPQQPPQPLTSLDPIFERLHQIRNDDTNNLSVRIRFKILDICELRGKENWQSKRTKDNNPKTIDEIREAHMEKLESERQRNAMGPRRSQEGRRNINHPGSSNQLSSLDPNNRGGSMHKSASSQSIRDHSLGEVKLNELEQQKQFQNTKATVMGLSMLKNVSASKTTSSLSSHALRPSKKFEK